MELLGGLVVLEDRATVSADEVIGTRDDRVEDGIDVQCRAEGMADFPECLQLPNRPRQILRPGLELLEQPHILYGDHGLVGEGLEQCDLVVGEWPGLRAAHGDESDGLTLAHHGYDEVAAKADCTAQLSKGVLRIELDVRYVDDGAFEDRPARPHCPARRSRPGTTCRLPRGRSPVVGSDDV